MLHLRGARSLFFGAIFLSLASAPWVWAPCGWAAGPASASAPADSTPEAHWVFFRDRGPAPPSGPDLAEAARALSPRALARRAKALRERRGLIPRASLVDERDLAPAASYVAGVEATGASIRTRSRWLNAVSVDAAPRAIEAIRALPFVRAVQPIADGEPAHTMSVDEFSYGPAASQLEMLGIPQAHAMGYRGEGVLICVLDSGFELGHEAFDQLVVRAERDFVFHDADTSYDPRQDLPNQANHGTTVLSVSPAVISVGSVDRNGRISPFSSVGPTSDRRVKPDLVAMGSGARMVTARTRDRYGFGSGTSYSTPLIAGCAAIVMSAHPDWGPEAVRDALLMSGDRASRPDPRYGWGIPNVRDAVLYPALEGKITDLHTGEPIGGARVEWEPAAGVDSSRFTPGDTSARGSARSDSTGAYMVPNLPPGSFRLRVDAPGYLESVSGPLEVPPSLGDVNFALRYRGE